MNETTQILSDQIQMKLRERSGSVVECLNQLSFIIVIYGI